MKSTLTCVLVLALATLAAAALQKTEFDVPGEAAARHDHCSGGPCFVGTFQAFAYQPCPAGWTRVGHNHTIHCDCCVKNEST